VNFMRLIGSLWNPRHSQAMPNYVPTFVERATTALHQGCWTVESHSHDRVLFEHREKRKAYLCCMVDRKNNVVSVSVAGNALIPDCIYDEVESLLRRSNEQVQHHYRFTILNDRRGSIHVITWTGPMLMVGNGVLSEILPEMCWNNDVTDSAIRDFYQLWLRNNHHARRHYS
jgi:hypothetical protein